MKSLKMKLVQCNYQLLIFQCIRKFLKGCMIVDISEEIREQTIRIRRSKKIKLPDAIIAATAIKCGVPLLTADTGLFNN